MMMRETTTNQVEDRTARLGLDQLSAVMLDRKSIPVGFIVSNALWKSLCDRLQLETGSSLGSMPQTLQGVKIAVDPTMSQNEFDVAFTEEAWSKRLRSLREQQKDTR